MKNILIGVTGGIAAYKSANIISMLRKKGFNVKVIMTKNATNIIPPLTLETLSKNRVITDMWEKNHQVDVEHISLADWADIILVAPATYNIIGKIANGIADDMLSTVISAANKKAPVFFALAMNTNMYDNPILKENIDKLKRYNYKFIEAEEGFLACNVTGKGRLKKEENIVDIIEDYINKFNLPQILKNKKVLITAGPTEEAIDPIRYLSNKSSGKMGYSLAIAAANLGADVTLISGPTNLNIPTNVKNFIQITTAQEMYDEVFKYYENTDIAIACAAVADYRAKSISKQKIKKSDDDLTIILERNPDILFTMGQLKKRQTLIGFAAETENLIQNATQKLIKKNLDFIIANNANVMRNNTNSVTLLSTQYKPVEFKETEKEILAYDLLLKIGELA